MSRIRRIAEEEFILVVLLAGFGFIFLWLFPPLLLVNDSWLNLMAGREIWENGLPRTEELTVYGLGSTWTAQQWLSHLFFYGLHALGGHALLVVVTCLVVVSAFAIGSAGARSLGAGPRAISVMFIPMILTAPWAWTIRAQMLALPFYTAILWLLASQARHPTRRIWLAFPLLALWANVHGSAALGALLLSLLGVYEIARSRGRSWRRSLVLVVGAPIALLLTPYGPAATARYYHLLLIDPPFAGKIREWMWPSPSTTTAVFWGLIVISAALVVWGRRRLTLFDLVILVITLGGALTAVRGIAWFGLACMLILPVAIGRTLESRNPAPLRRGINRTISAGFVAALLLLGAYSLVRDPAWFEDSWPREPVETVRRELEPGDRVFAPDRFADWLLWKIPELRGRIAYDVRFELYDEEFFYRLLRYLAEDGDDWKTFADGYRIVLVDETRRSHTADFLVEPDARALYRDEEITVITRWPAS